MSKENMPGESLEFFIDPATSERSEGAPAMCLAAAAEEACGPGGAHEMAIISDELAPADDIGEGMAEQRIRCRVCLAKAVMQFSTSMLHWVEDAGFTRGVIDFPDNCPLAGQSIADSL
jgi:hypothetical protein